MAPGSNVSTKVATCKAKESTTARLSQTFGMNARSQHGLFGGRLCLRGRPKR